MTGRTMADLEAQLRKAAVGCGVEVSELDGRGGQPDGRTAPRKGSGMSREQFPWRVRLSNDHRPEAARARAAYRSMLICAPSYWDKDGHEAYGLSREQAAEALWAWRTAVEETA